MYIVKNALQCAPSIFRLRHETFKERLDWEVKSENGRLCNLMYGNLFGVCSTAPRLGNFPIWEPISHFGIP